MFLSDMHEAHLLHEGFEFDFQFICFYHKQNCGCMCTKAYDSIDSNTDLLYNIGLMCTKILLYWNHGHTIFKCIEWLLDIHLIIVILAFLESTVYTHGSNSC